MFGIEVVDGSHIIHGWRLISAQTTKEPFGKVAR